MLNEKEQAVITNVMAKRQEGKTINLMLNDQIYL